MTTSKRVEILENLNAKDKELLYKITSILWHCGGTNYTTPYDGVTFEQDVLASLAGGNTILNESIHIFDLCRQYFISTSNNTNDLTLISEKVKRGKPPITSNSDATNNK